MQMTETTMKSGHIMQVSANEVRQKVKVGTTQKKLSAYLEKHLESSQMEGDNKRNENNNVG